MSFAVEESPVNEGICVAVAGEVDIDSAPRMRRALMNALASSRPVTVDLGAVTFLDSSGLAVLVAAHQNAEANGQAFRLQHVPASVHRVIGITGLDAMFVITPAPENDLLA